MSKSDDNPAARVSKVAIVDDHPIVRQGLAQVINRKDDLTVCCECDNAADALKLFDKCRPDVAVVDLSLKDSSGLDLIKDIAVRFPDIAVLVLSMRDESLYAERALRAGARGYVTKAEGTEIVIEGIRRVLAGEIYLSQAISGKVLRAMLPGRGKSAGDPTRRLSDRELEVLNMIGSGQGTGEIAAHLHLSVKTIESYRERLKQKLGLVDAAGLLKYAIQFAREHEEA